MNLGQRFVERLRWLAEGEGLLASPDAPLLVAAAGDRRTVEAVVCELGRLAAEFRCLRVRVDAQAEPREEALVRASRSIAERVSYLLERLDAIESDPATARLQMRSVPPRRRGDRLEYYELLLAAEDGGLQAELRRWTKTAGRRELAPIHLTAEVVERLIDDLADSLLAASG
jgi:hypothetical protein